MPSGRFGGNSAWVLCAAIAHNLLHAADTLAGKVYAVARGAPCVDGSSPSRPDPPETGLVSAQPLATSNRLTNPTGDRDEQTFSGRAGQSGGLCPHTDQTSANYRGSQPTKSPERSFRGFRLSRDSGSEPETSPPRTQPAAE
jgi:hypothetical protein